MVTPAVPPASKAATGSVAAHYLKLASGPAAFAAVLLSPIGLSPEGKIALATFACAVLWWITQPIPWAIAAILPMIVFPAAGIMNINQTLALYGHPIFFWIMGTVLMGYAIEKHGLARRFALAFLALPGVGGKMRRLALAYMTVTGLTSMFVSDTAVVAMLMPIGMSLVRHVQNPVAAHGVSKTNLAAFMTLATLYASLAGGTATMIGIPHNAIAVSLVEELTGRSIGWFDWMVVGVPVFVSCLLTFYALLWWMVPPGVNEVPTGAEFIRVERQKIGRMTANEQRVLLVFSIMVLLFTAPAITALLLGDTHPLTDRVEAALPIWVVPPALMLLLFIVPASDARPVPPC